MSPDAAASFPTRQVAAACLLGTGHVVRVQSVRPYGGKTGRTEIVAIFSFRLCSHQFAVSGERWCRPGGSFVVRSALDVMARISKSSTARRRAWSGHLSSEAHLVASSERRSDLLRSTGQFYVVADGFRGEVRAPRHHLPVEITTRIPAQRSSTLGLPLKCGTRLPTCDHCGLFSQNAPP